MTRYAKPRHIFGFNHITSKPGTIHLRRGAIVAKPRCNPAKLAAFPLAEATGIKQPCGHTPL
jgi:hypothetical protein